MLLNTNYICILFGCLYSIRENVAEHELHMYYKIIVFECVHSLQLNVAQHELHTYFI